MHLSAQRLSHLPATHVRDRMQGETVEELIVVEQIFPDAVDDQVQQLVLLVEEEGHGQVPDLLLGILVGRDQVDGLEVAKVDVPAEDVDIQQL